ncbi:MAG TPA: uracil phosphoribosyltransferase [Verrucomicrobiales bacterium]|nr:uracil phosphoribosyltransferase [Verrucomicrobiales bacterium]
MPLCLIEHPLVQDKLTRLRRRDTPSPDFRRLLHEIALLMGYEVTRDLEIGRAFIHTPVAPMEAPILARPAPCLVSILRAGNGLLAGLMDLLPESPVGHVGLFRDEVTLQPVQYYFNAPHDLGERLTIVTDPMLATGHSAAAAVTRIKEAGAREIRFLCLVAAPEGVDVFSEAHPDVPVHAAALDKGLNDQGYIVPGLGDAGDRIYGTVEP